jgi:hypothetical protein
MPGNSTNETHSVVTLQNIAQGPPMLAGACVTVCHMDKRSRELKVNGEQEDFV